MIDRFVSLFFSTAGAQVSSCPRGFQSTPVSPTFSDPAGQNQLYHTRFTQQYFLGRILFASAQWSRCHLEYSCGHNFPCILGSCYRSILSKSRVWKSQKTNISHGCLDPNTLRQIFLDIAWQNWPFKIGLSLFDFKQILVDSGTIVHCDLITNSFIRQNQVSAVALQFADQPQGRVISASGQVIRSAWLLTTSTQVLLIVDC